MLRDLLNSFRGAGDEAATLAPDAPSLAVVFERVEAAEFLERDDDAAIEAFGLLAFSVDAALERGRRDLAGIEAIEAVPRPHGRTHGLEWAYDRMFVDADRLRQVAALIRALAPHEAEIRALLTKGSTRP